jgi:hypothetical protein
MNLKAAQEIRNSTNAGAIGAMLRDLIDYAGLFPPASLAMDRALANYDVYANSEWNWILGRFIVPAARLDEFRAVFAGLPLSHPEIDLATWRLSVLLGADAAADVSRIHKFNDQMASRRSGRNAVIESVEVKASSVAEITRLAEMIAKEFVTYFEFSPSESSDCVSAVAGCGRRAKIRTGGETVDKFPSSAGLIEFICRCGAANVPFKATAGLHHPLRSPHRLTYRPDSPSGMMHGFLNLFLAASFVRAGMDALPAMELLDEQSSRAIHFDGDEVSWREHRLSHRELSKARQNFAISFGSCSFTEPIDDLRSLNLL